MHCICFRTYLYFSQVLIIITSKYNGVKFIIINAQIGNLHTTSIVLRNDLYEYIDIKITII